MIPRLMVADLARSLEFYCGVLGFRVQFAVTRDHEVRYGGDLHGAVFCSIAHGATHLMLETAEAGGREGATVPAAGTVSLYFSGASPEAVLDRLAGRARLLRGPETSWYGMREVTIADPDGYVICIAAPAARDGAVRDAA